ncbi:hypothetical protein GGI04_004469, partial [Coemansia thaxteri]
MGIDNTDRRNADIPALEARMDSMIAFYHEATKKGYDIDVKRVLAANDIHYCDDLDINMPYFLDKRSFRTREFIQAKLAAKENEKSILRAKK